MASKLRDIYSGIFFMLFSIFLFIMSFYVTETSEALGPDFFPRIVAFAIAILSIVLIVKGLAAVKLAKSKPDCEVKAKKEYKPNYSFILSSILLVVYMLLIKQIGFIILSSIYLFCQILLISPKEDMKRKNIIISAIISVVVPVALYYTFYKAFNIFLPPGLLG